MAPPARTITVAFDMSQAFYTRNIHTHLFESYYRPRFQAQSLSSSLHQGTQSLHNIYKSLILATSIQNWCSIRWRLLTNTIQNLHCRHNTTLLNRCSGWCCADDIIIISTHTSTSAVREYIQPYMHKVFCLDKTNNLTLNPDKTTCTLLTPDPAEYKSNMDLYINNTLHPKLAYSTHIRNISVQVHKPVQMIKALTATGI